MAVHNKQGKEHISSVYRALNSRPNAPSCIRRERQQFHRASNYPQRVIYIPSPSALDVSSAQPGIPGYRAYHKRHSRSTAGAHFWSNATISASRSVWTKTIRSSAAAAAATARPTVSMPTSCVTRDREMVLVMRVAASRGGMARIERIPSCKSDALIAE